MNNIHLAKLLAQAVGNDAMLLVAELQEALNDG